MSELKALLMAFNWRCHTPVERKDGACWSPTKSHAALERARQLGSEKRSQKGVKDEFQRSSKSRNTSESIQHATTPVFRRVTLAQRVVDCPLTIPLAVTTKQFAG